MASSIVARLGVKVSPDTTGFSQGLKKILRRIEETESVKIPVDAEAATRAGLKDWSDDAQEKVRTGKIKVKVPIRAADDGEGGKSLIGDARDRTQAANEKIAGDAKIRLKIPVVIDRDKLADDLRSALRKAITKLSVKDRTLEVELRLETTKATEQFKRWREKQNNKDVDLNVNVDHKGRASAQLAYIARNRFVQLFVQVRKESLAQAERILSALSGFNLVKGAFDGLRGFIDNLDRKALRFGNMATKIGLMASSVLALIGGAVTLGGDLLSIGAFATTLPAAAGALVAFGLAGVAAFKNFKGAIDGNKEAIEALPPAAASAASSLRGTWTSIQKLVQVNFWAKMEGSVERMAERLIPEIRTGMAKVGTETGRFTRNFMAGLSSREALASIQQTFSNTATGVNELAGYGMEFSRAIVEIGKVGSRYLPDMAKYLGEALDTFSRFVTRSDEAGKFDVWMANARTNAGLLGQALKDITGIFRGIGTAARDGGINYGLGGLASTLEKMRRIVEGGHFQEGMKNLFAGAKVAMEEVGVGLARVGRALSTTSPVIRRVFGLIGGTVRDLLTGVAGGIQTTGFQRGFESLFKGIATAASGLARILPRIFEALGSVGDLFGTIIAEYVPILAKFFADVGAIFTDIMPTMKEFAKTVAGLTGMGLDTLVMVMGLFAKALEAVLSVFNSLPSAVQMFLFWMLVLKRFKLLGPGSIFNGKQTAPLKNELAKLPAAATAAMKGVQTALRSSGSVTPRITSATALTPIPPIRNIDRERAIAGARAVGRAMGLGLARTFTDGAQRAALGLRPLGRQVSDVLGNAYKQGTSRIPTMLADANRKSSQAFRTALQRDGGAISRVGALMRSAFTPRLDPSITRNLNRDFQRLGTGLGNRLNMGISAGTRGSTSWASAGLGGVIAQGSRVLRDQARAAGARAGFTLTDSMFRTAQSQIGQGFASMRIGASPAVIGQLRGTGAALAAAMTAGLNARLRADGSSVATTAASSLGRAVTTLAPTLASSLRPIGVQAGRELGAAINAGIVTQGVAAGRGAAYIRQGVERQAAAAVEPAKKAGQRVGFAMGAAQVAAVNSQVAAMRMPLPTTMTVAPDVARQLSQQTATARQQMAGAYLAAARQAGPNAGRQFAAAMGAGFGTAARITATSIGGSLKKGFETMGGGWGLAITGLFLLLGQVAKENQKIEESARKATEAIKGISSAAFEAGEGFGGDAGKGAALAYIDEFSETLTGVTIDMDDFFNVVGQKPQDLFPTKDLTVGDMFANGGFSKEDVADYMQGRGSDAMKSFVESMKKDAEGRSGDWWWSGILSGGDTTKAEAQAAALGKLMQSAVMGEIQLDNLWRNDPSGGTKAVGESLKKLSKTGIISLDQLAKGPQKIVMGFDRVKRSMTPIEQLSQIMAEGVGGDLAQMKENADKFVKALAFIDPNDPAAFAKELDGMGFSLRDIGKALETRGLDAEQVAEAIRTMFGAVTDGTNGPLTVMGEKIYKISSMSSGMYELATAVGKAADVDPSRLSEIFMLGADGKAIGAGMAAAGYGMDEIRRVLSSIDQIGTTGFSDGVRAAQRAIADLSKTELSPTLVTNFETAMKEIGESADDAATKADKLWTAIDKLFGGKQTVYEANASLDTSFKDLNKMLEEALKGTEAGADGNSEAIPAISLKEYFKRALGADGSFTLEDEGKALNESMVQLAKNAHTAFQTTYDAELAKGASPEAAQAAAQKNVDAVMKPLKEKFQQAVKDGIITQTQMDGLFNNLHLDDLTFDVIPTVTDTGARGQLSKLALEVQALTGKQNSITVDVLDSPAIAAIQSVGGEVTRLENGKYRIDIGGNAEEAKTILRLLIADVLGSNPSMPLDADPTNAKSQITGVRVDASRTAARMSIDGDPTLFRGQVGVAAGEAAGTTATMPITGKITSIDQSLLNAVSITKSIVGIITFGGASSADGNIFNAIATGKPLVKAFANGGLENHTAQIRKSNSHTPVRVWAEPETGGEAYIPLSPYKRGRSVAILEEVARRFNMSLVKSDSGIRKYANGSSGGDGTTQVINPGVSLNITNINPVAEPTSKSVSRAGQVAASLGG